MGAGTQYLTTHTIVHTICMVYYGKQQKTKKLLLGNLHQTNLLFDSKLFLHQPNLGVGYEKFY